MKILQSSNFSDFRNFFRAKLEKFFLVPADTFDNVKGQFPIGFFIWDAAKKEIFKEEVGDIYNKNEIHIGTKTIFTYDNYKYINNWYSKFYDNKGSEIGVMNTRGNDFQNQNYIRVSSDNNFNHTNIITVNNLIESSIYYTVRHCIEANWLNDRDQFLYPNSGWEKDREFQNDCLAYTLFNNNIQSKYGTNNWIPFTEYEVGARDKFDSNFMTNFIAGKTEQSIVAEPSLFDKSKPARTMPLKFSTEAKNVFATGKALWKYYHKQPDCNINASLYDIREHFQGRNDKGRMNAKSDDESYMKLIKSLREQLHNLAIKIQPKVYTYGFLKV